VIPDPFAGVASLSFRSSVAIADLADGTYSSSDTLTFNGTSVSGINISGHHSFSASGFTIQTDSYDKRYFTVSPENSQRYAFGPFNLGFTDFTVVFVISLMNLENTDFLTYGIYPDNEFNITIGNIYGFWNAEYPYTQVSTTQKTNYSNATYLLKMVSYKHSTSTLTIMFRTDTSNNHQEFNITSHTFPTSQERAFALTASAGPHRVYELMTFPGEYMTSDRATYPLFGTVEDYVSNEYGIHPPP